jgi:hypothetical protein
MGLVVVASFFSFVIMFIILLMGILETTVMPARCLKRCAPTFINELLDTQVGEFTSVTGILNASEWQICRCPRWVIYEHHNRLFVFVVSSAQPRSQETVFHFWRQII